MFGPGVSTIPNAATATPTTAAISIMPPILTRPPAPVAVQWTVAGRTGEGFAPSLGLDGGRLGEDIAPLRRYTRSLPPAPGGKGR
jgi:hypothetical protein